MNEYFGIGRGSVATWKQQRCSTPVSQKIKGEQQDPASVSLTLDSLAVTVFPPCPLYPPLLNCIEGSVSVPHNAGYIPVMK